MIYSMTGFGKAEANLFDKKIAVEIRSLNSKTLDINTRLPSRYREMEAGIRKQIAAGLQRGKIDFSLYYESTNGESASSINTPVVRSYMEQLAHIATLEDQDKLKIAMQLPDTLKIDREALDPTEKEQITALVQSVVEQLTVYRSDEGKVLQGDFEKRIALLTQQLQEIEQIDQARKQKIQEKLRDAVDELTQKIDQNRFEQELIYYLEKLDITEEKVRLNSHLNYFIETLEKTQSQGKKLGFIAQEIGREINTIGSKANDADLQKVVVQMKDELEKIKEQLLNVL